MSQQFIAAHSAKDQNEVRALIAGPTVFICDECVEVRNDIVSGTYDDRSASDEIIPIAWLHGGQKNDQVPHVRASMAFRRTEPTELKP